VPTIEPPNLQAVRPQRLIQVGHEGNPVECSVVVGGGDLLTPDEPTLVPPRLPGGSGGESPTLPLIIASGGDINCYFSECTTIMITGGLPPYEVETTNGVLTQVNQTTYTLCANANPGSGVAGNAYQWAVRYCKHLGFSDCVQMTFDCAGNIAAQPAGGCNAVGTEPCGCATAGCADIYPADDCIAFAITHVALRCQPYALVGDACTGLLSYHNMCDARTQPMKDAGCSPCAINMAAGAIVTVTDSLGRIVSVAVESV